MKHAKTCTAAALFLLCILSIISCAKPPTEEMEQAEAAMARAEADSDVQLYAQNALARARETIGAMRSEAEAKRYAEAKRLAAEAVAAAERAMQEGKNAVIRMRDDAANSISMMEGAITDTGATIENARSAKQQGVDFDEIDKEYMDANAGAESARSANSEQRYRDAIDVSASVRTQLGSITSKIGQTAIAANRKK